MKSAIVKRSVVINGHKTSVSLEEPFWNGVREIAQAEQKTVSALLCQIDGARTHANLSSAVRIFVLEHARATFLARQAPRADFAQASAA
jgi:predicted DNA-binding ribbon-helix-helix protein